MRDRKASPDAWGSYQARGRRGGQGWWYALGLLALAAVLVVAVGPGRVSAWFGAEDTSALPAETSRPENAPATPPAMKPTGAHPFRGSPAARWADGRAGITVPAARATGWMSRKQVADALADTVDFLAASNLDPAVLRGERPREAIDLINPRQKDIQEFLKTAFGRTPTREHNPLRLFSRFDTSLVQPATKVVKTRGRLDFREGTNGALRVTSDVTFVYALERAGGGEVTRTIVRRELVVNWDDPSKVITEPGTFSLVSFKSTSTNGGCDQKNPVFAPTFDSDRAAGSVEGSGPEKDPYDRSESLDTMKDSDECGAASRI
ncbi:hypothetical protein ACQYWQ_12920 [Streptomyces sp. P6-2-1]|uniref:hypothetical protein n=1 Tax=Streptomyces sp. P6-2-1 TaxID=3422591 RepID=UPI003D363382